jgi:hypothetical protein
MENFFEENRFNETEKSEVLRILGIFKNKPDEIISGDDISTNSSSPLTEFVIRRLVDNGILDKSGTPRLSPGTEISLTDKGKELLPLVEVEQKEAQIGYLKYM